MKRKLLLFLCFLTVFLSASADRKGTMNILGASCSYDTLLHRHIAPGSTLTTLNFGSIKPGYITYRLRCHIITIDMTNQYNNLTTEISRRGYYTDTSVLTAYEHPQGNGKIAASISGFAFTESGNGDGTTRPYEVRGSMIGDGIVYHQDRGSNTHYYYGADRLAHITGTQFSGSVTVGSENWTIGQVNRFRDKADSYGELSLFCNGIGESKAADWSRSNGADVKVKLLNSSKKVKSGEPIECEVVAVYNGAGNSFGEGEAILSGVGDAATKLKTLTVGQKVTINVNTLDGNGNKLSVSTLIPVFAGYAVSNGNVTSSEGLVNTAVVIIGVSEDQKKTYIGVIDAYESDATYQIFAYVMKNLGSHNALFLDGGPSVDLCVEDKVLTHNTASNAGGRAMGSTIMLYSTAPNDNAIASVELEDPSPITMNQGNQVVIKAWGLNQYGETVSSDALNSGAVSLSCTNDLGIFYGNKFQAQAKGTGEIIIRVNSTGNEVRIPLKVEGEVALAIAPRPMYTGLNRPCQAKLLYTSNNNTVVVSDPSEAEWSCNAPTVVKSCVNGLVIPEMFNGKQSATLTAKYRGLSASITVIVDNMDDDYESINMTDKVSEDTKVNTQIPSVPRSFIAKVETNPNNTVTLKWTTAFEDHRMTKTADADGKIEFKVVPDYDDSYTYPITVQEVKSDNPCKIVELIAYYTENTGIGSITVDNKIDTTSPAYNLSGQRINLNGYRGIVIQNGKKVLLNNK